MTARTRPAALKGAAARIRHVRRVIGRIQRLAVPARREPHVGHDALGARPRGHRVGLGRAGGERVEADKGHLAVAGGFGLGAPRRVADDHAEARLEGLHLAALVRGRVVDCHAAAAGAVEADVGPLGDADVGPVAGAEVEDGGPVIGEVLGEGAGCAGGLLLGEFCEGERGEGGVIPGGFLGDVVAAVVHGDVESVTANDLVNVRGLGTAGEDEAMMGVSFFEFGGR